MSDVLYSEFSATEFVANSKYKIQALFKDFQGPKLHFSSTKIIDKKPHHRRGHSTFRLQYDTEVYCTVLTNTVMVGDMHTSACFKIVNKCKISEFARLKFNEFSRIFKYFQAAYLFSSTFKDLEVFIPNSSIFKDFSSML